jgi:tetratricopeptide (TPR) repeat protein
VMTLVLLAVLCATAAVAWLADGASVHLPLRGRALGAVGVAAVVAAVVAIIAADPADRWEDFTAPPADLASPGSAVASDDLGSSGRWQFWGEALEAFESRPITGIGAGAFEDWWAQNATIPVFVRNPHSLGLQQLSELGIAGFLLFAAFAGTVAFAAWRRLRTAPRGDGSVLVGVLAASAVGTAVDWTWAIPAVIAPGIAAAAMLTASTPGERRRAPGYWLGLATLALGWVLAVSGALLTLGELKLEASRQAAGEERFDDALNRADEAETVMPWSSEPRLQLALVLEERREVGAALDELAAAGARDEDDWRIPYIESRLLLAQGDVAEAYAAYERARSLAPLSPVFRGGAPQ